MKLRYAIVILLFLFTRCSGNEEAGSSAGISFDSAVRSHFTANHVSPTSPIGEWEYGVLFYSRGLTIRADSTFQYIDHGCMGSHYSEGRWASDGTDIILKSYKKYAHNNYEVITTREPESAIKPKFVESTDIMNQAIIDTGNVAVADTTKPEFFEPTKLVIKFDSNFFKDLYVTTTVKLGDTTNVYFNRTRLRLQGDTLYELDKKGMKTYTRYTLLKRS